MVEITNGFNNFFLFFILFKTDIQFLLPIMVSVSTAKFTADRLCHALYDWQLVTREMPFLEPEPPRHTSKMTASDVMAGSSKDITSVDAIASPTASYGVSHSTSNHKRNGVVCFNQRVSVEEIVYKLKTYTHRGFPVVDSQNHFLGLILSRQLELLLGLRVWTLPQHQLIMNATQFRERMYERRIDVFSLSLQASDLSAIIDLGQHMNRSVLTIHSEYSCESAYRLFRSMGLRHLPVVNAMNQVVGIITRKDLMEHSIDHVYNDLTRASSRSFYQRNPDQIMFGGSGGGNNNGSDEAGIGGGNSLKSMSPVDVNLQLFDSGSSGDSIASSPRSVYDED
jgi:CBS domain-containing protein